MGRGAVLFLTLAALALMAPRRLPPPTPAAGLYRLETLAGPVVGQVAAVCHAPGLGGFMFGDARRPREGLICGELRVTRVGDGWDARQTCNTNEGTYSAAAMARREPNGDLRVDYAMQPRSRSAPARPVQAVLIRRLAARCPPPLRPGQYVILVPRPQGGPWRVNRIGDPPGTLGDPLAALPPALRALDAAQP